jgi:hypothetical protein
MYLFLYIYIYIYIYKYRGKKDFRTDSADISALDSGEDSDTYQEGIDPKYIGNVILYLYP